MNLNLLAKRVAQREGLKKSVDIAQIKEVIWCVFAELDSEGYFLCEWANFDKGIAIARPVGQKRGRK